MDDTEAAVSRFNAHLDQLAAEAGVELDDQARQRIFGQSVAEASHKTPPWRRSAPS
jgi:hypothetical protein